jgi:hypothetical protein
MATELPKRWQVLFDGYLMPSPTELSPRVTVGAEDAEHRAWIGAAEFAHTLALPAEAARTASHVADRTLSLLHAYAADRDARQMLGQLHLCTALACATDQRPDDARMHLTAADHEATSLGEPPDGAGFNLNSFGPTNVGLWRMAISAELGDYGRVVAISRTIEPRQLRMANRRQVYWLTLGRALTHSGRADRQALTAFVNAERIAPTGFGLDPGVRNAIMSMVNRARRRTIPDELRTLARRVGIESGA